MADLYIRYPGNYVAISGTVNVGSITGPIALPTGAATSANQLLELSELQRIGNAVNQNTAAFTGWQMNVGGYDPLGQGIVWKFDASGNGLVGLSDGTNTVAIKAASTAPLATDPSLVVSISPNSGISITDPAEGTPGAAVPAKAIYVAGNKGGLLTGLSLDSAGSLESTITKIQGTVDTSNSSTTPLGVGGVFTGSWVLNTNLASIQIGLKADQDSATNGVEMQFSNDGVNVDHTHNYTYYASGGGIGYLFQPEFKYYRMKFTNGAVGQASFVLVTTTRATALFPSQYRVSTVITNETQALMTKAVITGQTTGMGGGFVNVKVTPSGALTTDTTLTGLDAAILGQKTMANSLPVVIASDQSAVSVNGTVSVTGVSTASNQTNGNQKTQIVDGSGNVIGSTSNALNVNVSSGTVTATNSANGNTGAAVPTQATYIGGTKAGNLTGLTLDSSSNLNVAVAAALPAGSNNIGTVNARTSDGSGNAISSTGSALWVDVQASALPSGAATSANQTTLGSQTTKINDGTNTAAVKAASTAAAATDPALVVAVSPNNSISTTRKGSTSANAPVYNVYSSVNITTAAYTQLVASTTSATNAIDIFDSSGQAMILATGAAGAETIVAYVPPGGAYYQVAIPASTRVAYKALTANATSGYLLIDFWS